ncbi:MAG TPA: SDR family oxidoreductase [Verrucomicrobiota bacterium]|nr:SDR family oxidoreductase [Verrucomicrobiota bacterium]
MNHNPTAWITGAAGLIGNCLVQTAAAHAPGWRVIALTRAELDLLDFDAVRRAFHERQPSLVIHCAAMTRTPQCQTQPDEARRSNVDVTALLAELAANIPFFFFSTDLVFDGQKGNYAETDPVNPISVYAQTKVEAERIVLCNPRHTVVRAGLNAGVSITGDRAFNEQMRIAWENGRTLDLFTDEFRCPIPAPVTARAVWELARKGATGLFHVCGSERLSRFEIGKLLAARWPQLNPKIVPASAKGYQGAARCPDVSMNCAKAQRLLSFPLPRFSDWLAAHPSERI